MTRSFARVERFFERVLERPAARLFRAPIQPVQLQHRLERELEARRLSDADRTYVPNRYRILLNPIDAAQFEDDRTMLQSDLADALLRRARSRGYRMVARPEVLVIPSAEVAPGEPRIVVDALDPGLVRSAAAGLRAVDLAGPRPPRPPIPATAEVPAVAPPPAASAPNAASAPRAAPTAASLVAHPVQTDPAARSTAPAPAVSEAPRIAALIEVSTRDGRPWAFVFRGGAVRIGRGTDNDLVLPDDRVSRRHGQLTARQGVLVYSDLGSSNGSLVNGDRVTEIALGIGDVVRVGNSTLTIRPGG